MAFMSQPGEGTEQETSTTPDFQYTAVSFDFLLEPPCPSLSDPAYNAFQYRDKLDIFWAIVGLTIGCFQFFRRRFGIRKSSPALFASSQLETGKVSGSYREASGTARQADFRSHVLG